MDSLDGALGTDFDEELVGLRAPLCICRPGDHSLLGDGVDIAHELHSPIGRECLSAEDVINGPGYSSPVPVSCVGLRWDELPPLCPVVFPHSVELSDYRSAIGEAF